MLPGMYAGMSGAGAPDAMWKEALEIETESARSRHYIGAVIDFVQAFDRLDKALVADVLRAAGMPALVLAAYEQYHANLWYRNSLGLGVGEAHQRPCSIPQGCALSMPSFSLLLRPWLVRMQAQGVSARTLADDIRLLVVQRDGETQWHLEKRFNVALEDTICFLGSMGADIALGKSSIFASYGAARRRYRHAKWGARLEPTHSRPDAVTEVEHTSYSVGLQSP